MEQGIRERTVVEGSVVKEDHPLAAPAQSTITLDQLGNLGFITPIASPEVLRAAFDQRQKMIAAILDPRDFIYTVPYVENGRQKQQVCNSKEEAEKWSAQYGTRYTANPKKSGVVKLAVALGIEAKRTGCSGLPDDGMANFSYATYVARHTRTGAEAEGVGWCDRAERGGRMSTHDIIAMADTRAYCRAVLRLAGLGDVSADEILGSPDFIGGGTQVVDGPAPTSPPKRPAQAAIQAPVAEVKLEAVVESRVEAEPETVSQGWNLSPGGNDDEILVTQAQAQKLSLLAVEKLGTKEDARKWLNQTFGLSRSTDMPASKYEHAIALLNNTGK